MVKPMDIPSDAPSLKKVLHERIEQLSVSKLSLLNRVLLQLEAEELAANLDEAFDADRKAGKLSNERIQGIIAQVRAEHPYR
ncbi:MAG TPA: hypothetical protein VG146_14660 [Verrucomicrobiae bacterium]|nr:hypothetical protein [Verrucomicrobiae bacterium]